MYLLGGTAVPIGGGVHGTCGVTAFGAAGTDIGLYGTEEGGDIGLTAGGGAG